MSEAPPPVDLQPDQLEIVRDILRRHVPEREVVAFGSRATRAAREYSDLDLAVLGDEPMSLSVSAALKDDFVESDLLFKVDVVDWAHLEESFRDIIRRDQVIVQKPPSRSDHNTSDAKWPIVTIEAISEKIASGPFGSQIKVETFVHEGMPIISGQHLHNARIDDSQGFNFITEEHAQRLANAHVWRGDVIFTRAGNIGQVAYIPENSKFERYIVSPRQFYLRCDFSKAVPGFITAYFQSPEGQHKLLANASQVGVPSLAQAVTYLSTIKIPLPPLSEQRAIAHILGTLDDKIELNRRMNETLEAMAQAIFKDWFVDFGPTRAKMERRDPYLPPEIWDLFPNTLDATGKPTGWELRPISSFASIKGGKQLTKDKFIKNGPIPVFGGAGVMGYTDSTNADGFIISVGRVGAYCGQFFSYRGKAWINNNASRIEPLEEVPGEWLLLALRSLDIERIKKGAAQPFVSNSDIVACEVVDPGKAVLTAFERFIKQPMLRREASDRESANLAQIRDALLPKLLGGEIELHQVETIVEEAS